MNYDLIEDVLIPSSSGQSFNRTARVVEHACVGS